VKGGSRLVRSDAGTPPGGSPISSARVAWTVGHERETAALVVTGACHYSGGSAAETGFATVFLEIPSCLAISAFGSFSLKCNPADESPVLALDQSTDRAASLAPSLLDVCRRDLARRFEREAAHCPCLPGSAFLAGVRRAGGGRRRLP
jgi:hypothetical protein